MTTATGHTPPDEFVVTADDWIMQANPNAEQRAEFETWLDLQTGIAEVAGHIDAFAVGQDRVWCRFGDFGPTGLSQVPGWRGWLFASPVPATSAALIAGVLATRD